MIILLKIFHVPKNNDLICVAYVWKTAVSITAAVLEAAENQPGMSMEPRYLIFFWKTLHVANLRVTPARRTIVGIMPMSLRW